MSFDALLARVAVAAAESIGMPARREQLDAWIDAVDALAASSAAEGHDELVAACESTTQLLRAIESGAGDATRFSGAIESLLRFASAVHLRQDVPTLPRSAPREPVDPEMVAMFVQSLRSSIADLEGSVLDAQHGEAEPLAAVRRTMHTLKGEAGVLSLRGLQQLCHEAESAIDRSIDAQLPPPTDLLLEVVDWLRVQADALERSAADEPPLAGALLRRLAGHGGACGDTRPVELVVGAEYLDTLGDFLGEARQHLANAEQAMLGCESDGWTMDSIHQTFRGFHTIKGVAGFLNLGPMVEVAHQAETLLDRGRHEGSHFGKHEVDLVLRACDVLSGMLDALQGKPAPTRGIVAILLTDLAAACRGEAPVARATTPQATAEATSAVADPLVPRPTAAAGTAPVRPPKVDATVKVNTARLDLFVDMVGELVIAQSMVLQNPQLASVADQALSRNITQVGKITRDLQQAAMSLRMVTLKSTFQKMARLVRDVAAKAGKDVALVLEGEDTELDRTVVEEIADPLVHLIRNALDHGVETPAERERRGKSPQGTLRLRAYHEGGSIVIEIADDGKGIDRARVLAKAKEKGIVAADAPTPSDAEIDQLIFMPGFSTAEKVTDISGRGVGMDVVRRNIEALRGKIEIDSTVGKGTTFRMRLPLTLAIIDGMVVRVGSERYVIPTLTIEQSFRPDPKDVHLVQDLDEIVLVRGQALPIVRLSTVFGIRDGETALQDGILVVVESGGERCALFVDRILGQQQVVIKSLGLAGRRIANVSGGAILGDGRVALILDVTGFLRSTSDLAVCERQELVQ